MNSAERTARDATDMWGSIGTSQPRRRMTMHRNNESFGASAHPAVIRFHVAVVQHVA
jgi:hypothetical protein